MVTARLGQSVPFVRVLRMQPTVYPSYNAECLAANPRSHVRYNFPGKL